MPVRTCRLREGRMEPLGVVMSSTRCFQLQVL
jgi:hypothetical protein